MDGMNGKSAKISGPRPLASAFLSLFHSTIRHFVVWTNEEQREMEADYSGDQSSTWAVAPRGRKIYILTCYATEDAVQIVNSFYLQLTHVVTTITFYGVTHLHSLQSIHSNIFTLSPVVCTFLSHESHTSLLIHTVHLHRQYYNCFESLTAVSFCSLWSTTWSPTPWNSATFKGKDKIVSALN
jgi:hypothetical protein